MFVVNIKKQFCKSVLLYTDQNHISMFKKLTLSYATRKYAMFVECLF